MVSTFTPNIYRACWLSSCVMLVKPIHMALENWAGWVVVYTAILYSIVLVAHWCTQEHSICNQKIWAQVPARSWILHESLSTNHEHCVFIHAWSTRVMWKSVWSELAFRRIGGAVCMQQGQIMSFATLSLSRWLNSMINSFVDVYNKRKIEIYVSACNLWNSWIAEESNLIGRLLGALDRFCILK